MSGSSDVVQSEMDDKASYDGTVNEVQSKHNFDGIDGIDEAFFVNGVDPRFDGHTRSDALNMRRMGKKQELMRNYRSLSALSFAVILQATWEFLLISNNQGLEDGGLAGFFWTYLWTFLGFGLVMVSLAEMASMAPISGGQYHWVSEFAPPKYQKFLSYITGWMSTLSWQAGTAGGSYLTGTIIQGLAAISYPNYDGTRWQGTLLVFAMVAIIFFFNIWGAKSLPTIQNVLLVFHVVALLAIVIVIWTLAPLNNSHDVFLTFANYGGWSSTGLALQIGQVSAIYGSICSDAAAHMAEEIKDAGRNVPMAMFVSYVLNGFLGLLLVITLLYAITNLDDALNDPSGYPFIWVFRQALPDGGVIALSVILLVLVIASNISFNASTARQTFAFARDHGLPFHRWIAHVSPTKLIPDHAIALSCIITCLLALINIGSDVAFNAIASLQVCALMLTYSVSISCVLYRRLFQPELLPPARWSLGKWGPYVNAFGIGYVIYAAFWSFWPTTTEVNAESFNWSVVIFCATMIICLLMYWFEGRKVYDGPVVTVMGRKDV